MRIVSIINQKGGCGKTTTAINLAGIFARRGCRTLLVDLDPQSHCAAGLAIPEQRIDLDIGDAMLAEPGRGVDKKRLLWRASRNLDLAPSRTKLAGLEAARGGLADKEDAERRLAMALSRLAPSYDVCFIDCSPYIGLLTFNALAVATHILIPVETSFFALQGATKQLAAVRTMAKRLGTAADYWVVATLHDETSVLSRDLLEEMRRRFGGRVAPVAVRRDVALKEAASFGQPVVEYAPSSPGASDYGALADWLAGRLGLNMAIQGSLTAEPSLPIRQNQPADPAPVIHIEPKAMPEPAEPRPATPPAPTTSQTEQPPLRAEDLAEQARVMLLKRADEQLRRIIGSGETGAAVAAPRAGTPISLIVAPEINAQFATADAEPSSVAIEARELQTLEVEQIQTEGTPPPHLRNFFGVRQTRSGVLFVQPLSIGTWVAIAGDFNGWMPREHMMRRNEELGVFELCVPLPAGRRRYRLVVDGHWTPDPANPRTEPNEYGELNSIIDVGPAPASASTNP